MRMKSRKLFPVLLMASLLVAVGQVYAGPDSKDLPPGLSTIDVQGFPIVYRDQGKGDPLVIFTPYPFGTGLWNDLVDRLSRSARVIVVEPPGIRSPAAMEGNYASGHFLVIYRRFVKALGFTTVNVMGVGEAGSLAVAFGHHYPENTGSVISINGFESVHWSEKFEVTLKYYNQTTEMGHTALLTGGSAKYQKKPPSREELDRVFFPLTNDEQVKAVEARFKAYAHDVQEGYVLAMLPNVNRPVLLIRGEGDDILQDSETYIQRTRGQIRKVPVRYETVPQAGHFAFLDQPDKVADLITKFLSDHPKP